MDNKIATMIDHLSCIVTLLGTENNMGGSSKDICTDLFYNLTVIGTKELQ